MFTDKKKFYKKNISDGLNSSYKQSTETKVTFAKKTKSNISKMTNISFSCFGNTVMTGH